MGTSGVTRGFSTLSSEEYELGSACVGSLAYELSWGCSFPYSAPRIDAASCDVSLLSPPCGRGTLSGGGRLISWGLNFSAFFISIGFKLTLFLRASLFVPSILMWYWLFTGSALRTFPVVVHFPFWFPRICCRSTSCPTSRGF